MALRVLVVDDDAAVRGLLLRLLASRGHDVSLAAAGDEALARLGAGERFDLVISDYELPGADGLEVVARARERGARTLLVSGALDDDVRREAARRSTPVLAKPFSAAELLAAAGA
jgi:CheY-like chemotaxis protein